MCNNCEKWRVTFTDPGSRFCTLSSKLGWTGPAVDPLAPVLWPGAWHAAASAVIYCLQALTLKIARLFYVRYVIKRRRALLRE